MLLGIIGISCVNGPVQPYKTQPVHAGYPRFEWNYVYCKNEIKLTWITYWDLGMVVLRVDADLQAPFSGGTLRTSEHRFIRSLKPRWIGYDKRLVLASWLKSKRLFRHIMVSSWLIPFCDGNDFRFSNWRGYTAVLRRSFQDPKARHFSKDFHYSKTCKTCTYLKKGNLRRVFW